MTEAELNAIAVLRALAHPERARVLALFRVGKSRDEFGLTELERNYAEAFIVFEASGLDAAYVRYPNVHARRGTFEKIIADPHYYTKIRTVAKAIQKSRFLNPRRLVESEHLETE